MREVNDWLFFNKIVYKIYTVEDEHFMREHFLQQLNMLIDFDAADFYLSQNGDTLGLCDPVLYNTEVCSSDFDNLDYSRGLLYEGDCMAYRETDIISDETRVNTPYYKALYLPNGWHYSAQMICSYKKQLMGVVTLYRNKGRQNFSRDDILILDMLKEHIAYRLYKDKNINSFNIPQAVNKFCELYDLTKREKTVLEYIVSGDDNSDISNKLCISIHTLKKHILNIYRKADVNSRIQLINKVRDQHD